MEGMGLRPEELSPPPPKGSSLTSPPPSPTVVRRADWKPGGTEDVYKRQVLYQLTNVRVWDREIPVKEMMEQALGLPVVMANDATCMAYAEWKMGAGRGMSS